MEATIAAINYCYNYIPTFWSDDSWKQAILFGAALNSELAFLSKPCREQVFRASPSHYFCRWLMPRICWEFLRISAVTRLPPRPRGTRWLKATGNRHPSEELHRFPVCVLPLGWDLCHRSCDGNVRPAACRHDGFLTDIIAALCFTQIPSQREEY